MFRNIPQTDPLPPRMFEVEAKFEDLAFVAPHFTRKPDDCSGVGSSAASGARQPSGARIAPGRAVLSLGTEGRRPAACDPAGLVSARLAPALVREERCGEVPERAGRRGLAQAAHQ